MLANMFPGNYYSGDEAKALDFMGYFAHQNQQQEALRNNEINRQVALDDLFGKQQHRPLDLERKRLDNQGLETLMPEKKARADQATLDFNQAQQISPAKIKAALAAEAAKLTKEELAHEQYQVQQQLNNPFISPKERQVLELIRDNFPENYKLTKMLEGKETGARLGAEARVEAARIAANKPPAVRSSSTTQPKPFKDDLVAAQYWQQLADTTNNPEEKAQYAAVAEAARQRHRQLIQDKENAKKAGTVDLGATGVAVVPPITAPAQPPAAKPDAAPKASLADVQKMYPGVPDDKLKEAYKRKFGVDLK